MKYSILFSSFIIFNFIFFFFNSVDGARPSLVSSKLIVQNISFIGQDWKIAISDLEFDQPLYINEPHLCPLSDLACPAFSCTPCNWTDPSANTCQDANCCGPRQFTETNSAEFIDPWCDATQQFEVLQWNASSAVKVLKSGESTSYRFFFPDSMGCISFRIPVRYLYGNVNIYVSNRYPNPSGSDNQWDAKFDGMIPGYGFGQTDIDICPNFHSNYLHGTWAVTVEAIQDASFYLELLPGNAHPIPAMANPPTSRTCSSSPFGAGYRCVDDGESQFLQIPDGGFATEFLQYVFPIDAGCQHVSVGVWPVVESVKVTACDSDLFCYLISESAVMANTNAFAGTYRIGGDVEYATLCPTEPMWLQCAIQPWFPGDLYVVYSTQTPSFRSPMAQLPLYDFSIHSAFTSSALAYFEPSTNDPRFTLCADWFGGCISQWPISPSQQPTLFWPLPVEFSTLSSVHEFLGPPEYLLQNLNASNSHVLNMIILGNSDGVGYGLDILLPSGSIVLRTITNAAGEVPQLPSNFAPSFEHFVHIPVSQLALPNLDSFCELDEFRRLAPYISSTLKNIRSSTTLDDVLQNRFYLDLYANSLTYASCKELLASDLQTTLADVETSSITCLYDKNDPLEYNQWFADPCCNTDYAAFECCQPLSVSEALLVWDTPDSGFVNDTCVDPVCANSYFVEFTDAANTLLTKSGCVDTTYSTLSSSLNVFYDQLRLCRIQSGIGENYDGVQCQVDAECPPPGICSAYTGKCVPYARVDAENAFLRCFIDSFSVSFEDWLRNTHLPNAPANTSSSQFLQDFRAILVQPDCVSDNILAIAQRSRNVFQSSDIICLASAFSVDPNAKILTDELCRSFECLDASCLIPPSSCFRSCLAAYGLVESSEESCSPMTQCTTQYDASGCSDTSSSQVCAYCDPSGHLPCQTDPSLPTSESACQAQVACELPDGSVQFGLTADACANLPGACSVDCHFSSPQICRSLIGSKGVCHIPGNDGNYDACEQMPNIITYYFQGNCYLHHAATLEDCLNTQGGVWETCEGTALGSCDGSTVSQRYLQCYASDWGPCADQASCATAGYCTDRPLAIYYNPDTGATIDGACFTSGYYQPWIPDQSTECFTSQDRTINGCRTHGSVQSGCPFEYTDPAAAAYQHQLWMTPAVTEAQCLAQTPGRYGCITNDEFRTLWYDTDSCSACGGAAQNSFQWLPGVWKSPTPRPLSWINAQQKVPVYAWETDVLSFLEIEAIVFEYAEFQATFGLRSEALCSFSLIDNSLRPLVCSCAENRHECFSSLSPLALVGLSNPCRGKATFISTPSATTSFSEVSISSGCLEIQLSEINRASLGIPPKPKSVSFSLGPRKTLTGVVMNTHNYPVGELASNGLVIDFSSIGSLETFEVCLLIDSNATTPDYPVPDFAYSISYDYVIPLDFQITSKVSRGAIYWCSNVTKPSSRGAPFHGNTASFFAVYRVADFQDLTYDSYSQTTTALSYTLAALYIVVLVIVSMGFTWVIYLKVAHDRKLPIFAWAAPWFILLCIFRIVYCFGFPNGVWENDEVQNFIVFELPTFFYFTAFVIILSSFISALSSLDPSTTRRLNFCLVGAGVIIWLLFISVAIAVGVISNGNTLYSPCPGRVPEESTIDSQIRALSIAYQSIVIALIFLLALGFFLSAFLLVKNVSRAHKSVRRAISILRELFKSTFTIVVGFLARCILFLIILAANFESAIYMFITLFITEILVISVISVLWWKMSVDKHRESTSGGSSGRSSNRSSNS